MSEVPLYRLSMTAALAKAAVMKEMHATPRNASTQHTCTDRYSSQFKNNYFTEMCSDSEAGSYSRLIDFVITQL